MKIFADALLPKIFSQIAIESTKRFNSDLVFKPTSLIRFSVSGSSVSGWPTIAPVGTAEVDPIMIVFSGSAVCMAADPVPTKRLKARITSAPLSPTRLETLGPLLERRTSLITAPAF